MSTGDNPEAATKTSTQSQQLPPHRRYTLDQFSDDIEFVGNYCVGGYHPINIHDRLQDRYEIIHKLGHGSYSTIWLARDHLTKKNVAIKILVADNDRPIESKILSVLNKASSNSENGDTSTNAPFTTLLDHFEIEGPNGRHHCLTLTPASSSVSDSRCPDYGIVLFQLPVARAIIAQIAEAVAFIHRQGVVHGDLHLGNVLFALPEHLIDLPAEKFYEVIRDPPGLLKVLDTNDEPLPPNVPTHLVDKALIGKAARGMKLEEAAVVLADFGEAFQPHTTTRLELRTPQTYLPPEHIVQKTRPVSYTADIWSMGCIFFALMGQRGFMNVWLASDDELIQEQVDALGPLPADLSAIWEALDTNATEPPRARDFEIRPTLSEHIEKAIIRYRQEEDGFDCPDAEELRAFETLLRSMLAMSAEDRISAEEVLQSEWMVKWALPDLEKARRLWEKKDAVSAAQEEQEESASKDAGEHSTKVSMASEPRTIDKEDVAPAEPSKMLGENIEGPEAASLAQPEEASADQEQKEKQVNVGEATSKKTEEGHSGADKKQASSSKNDGASKELW